MKMTKTEIENKIHELGKKIAELIKEAGAYEAAIKEYKAAIERLKAEVEKPAFERAGEIKEYYTVSFSTGKAFVISSIDTHNSLITKLCFKNNNYFHTKERAEEVADKINFLLKLERMYDTFCPDYKPDWNDRIKAKWNVVFDYDEKEYVSYWNAVVDSHTTVYFDSKETVDKVCEILNKELEDEDM